MELQTDTIEITEGATRILVPRASLSDRVPPRRPAFFNPRARTNRDYSVIAYGAHLRSSGPKTMIDSMAGVGARGLRVAVEVPDAEVLLNDLNPYAVSLAQESARINGLDGIKVQQSETCVCLAEHSVAGARAAIVDVDPFGSPAGYLDCALRATVHGGLLSATATDMQVLHGMFDAACRRRYGGIPVRAEFGDEIATRLILGCLRGIAARLEMQIEPVWAERDMHYYRVYVRVLKKRDTADNMGFVFYCRGCGDRGLSEQAHHECRNCGAGVKNAGPLWTGPLFDVGFVGAMLEYCRDGAAFESDSHQDTLSKSLSEARLAGTYYTLDEIASRVRGSPPKLMHVIEELQKIGFSASPTSFRPTGFRTDAKIDEIKSVF